MPCEPNRPCDEQGRGDSPETEPTMVLQTWQTGELKTPASWTRACLLLPQILFISHPKEGERVRPPRAASVGLPQPLSLEGRVQEN